MKQCSNQDQFRFRHPAFFSQLKSKVDNILVKTRRNILVKARSPMTNHSISPAIIVMNCIAIDRRNVTPPKALTGLN
jgi:hypothetical protein